MEENKDPKLNPLLAAAGLHGLPWGWWAKYQLRSEAKGHKGWWIDMGSENHIAFHDGKGNIVGAKAIYVGPSSLGQGYGRFLVRGVEGVPDGIYHINSSKIVPIQAMISDEDIASLGYDVSHLTPDADEVVDLANTKVDPITEQDLLVASSKLGPLGDLASQAEKRGEMQGATHADLADGDIVYDPATKTYGSVLHVTPDNDKVSATVRWQGNRITTTTPVSKDAPVRIWKAPEEEQAQEMAGFEKGRKKIRANEVKPGDVLTTKSGEKVLVQKIERAPGGSQDIYYKDPETGETTRLNYSNKDYVDVSRGMGEEPGQQAPSTKPAKPSEQKAKMLTSDEIRAMSVGDEIFFKAAGAKGLAQYHLNKNGYIQSGDADQPATTTKAMTPESLADDLDNKKIESVFAGKIPANPTPENAPQEPKATETEKPAKRGIFNSKGQKATLKFPSDLSYGDIIVDRKNPDQEIGIVLGYANEIDPQTKKPGYRVFIQGNDGTFKTGNFIPNSELNSPPFAVIGARPKDIDQKNVEKLPKEAISKGKSKAKTKTGEKGGKKAEVVIPEGPVVIPETVASTLAEDKQPSQKQLDSVLRRIKQGVFPEQRAKEILANLPTASKTKVGSFVNEADKAEMLYNMANGLPIDNLRFPRENSDERTALLNYLLNDQKGTAIPGTLGSSGILSTAINYEVDEKGNINIIVPNQKFDPLSYDMMMVANQDLKDHGFVRVPNFRDQVDKDGNPKINPQTGTPYYVGAWVRKAKDGESDADRAKILSHFYKQFTSYVGETKVSEKDKGAVNATGRLGKLFSFQVLPSGDIAIYNNGSDKGYNYVPNKDITDTAKAIAAEYPGVSTWTSLVKNKSDVEALEKAASEGDSSAITALEKYNKNVAKHKKANPDWEKASAVVSLKVTNAAVNQDEVRAKILDALSKKFDDNKATLVIDKPEGEASIGDLGAKGNFNDNYTYEVKPNGRILITGDFSDKAIRDEMIKHAKANNIELDFSEDNDNVVVDAYSENPESVVQNRANAINDLGKIISGKAVTTTPATTSAPANDEEKQKQVEKNKADWEEVRAMGSEYFKLRAAGKNKEAEALRKKIKNKSTDVDHFISVYNELQDNFPNNKRIEGQEELDKLRSLNDAFGKYKSYITDGVNGGEYSPSDSDGSERFPHSHLLSKTDSVVPSTEPSEEPEPKPEYIDDVTKITPENNNHKYWDWVKDGIKNKSISNEDYEEALNRVFTDIVENGFLNVRYTKDDEPHFQNVLRDQVKFLAEKYAKEDPEISDEELLKKVIWGAVHSNGDLKRGITGYINSARLELGLSREDANSGLFKELSSKTEKLLEDKSSEYYKNLYPNGYKKQEPLQETKPVSNNGMVAKEPSTDISKAAGLAFTRTTGDSYHPTEVDSRGNPAIVYTPSPGPFSGEALREKLEAMKGHLGKTREFLDKSKVVSFDTETTGFNNFDGDGQLNRVVQWGFVVHNPDGTEERHSFFVRPSDGAKLSEWSAKNLVRPTYDKDGKVTGTTPLTDEWLQSQPSEEELLPRLLEILSGNPILLAHNIQYDLPLLHDMINRINANKSEEDKVKLSFAGAIDSLELARYITKRYDPAKGVLDGPSRVIDKSKDHNDPANRRSSNALPDVLEFLGLKPSGWHTADGDAEDSLRILGGLLNRAEDNPDSIPKNGLNGVTAFDFEKIDEKYKQNLENYLKYTSAASPATPRQKSANAKNGFADMLRDKYGIKDEKEIQNILEPLQNATRGQAYHYINKIRESLDTNGMADIKAAMEVAKLSPNQPVQAPQAAEPAKGGNNKPKNLVTKAVKDLEAGDKIYNEADDSNATVISVNPDIEMIDKKIVKNGKNGEPEVTYEKVSSPTGFLAVTLQNEDGSSKVRKLKPNATVLAHAKEEPKKPLPEAIPQNTVGAEEKAPPTFAPAKVEQAEEPAKPAAQKPKPEKKVEPAPEPKAVQRPLDIDLSQFTDEEKIWLKNFMDAVDNEQRLMAEANDEPWEPVVVKGLPENPVPNYSELEDASDRLNIDAAERLRFREYLDELEPFARNEKVNEAINLLNTEYNENSAYYDFIRNRREKKEAKRQEKWAKKQEKEKLKNITFAELADMIDWSYKEKEISNEETKRKVEEKKDLEPSEAPITGKQVSADINGLTISGAQELKGDAKNLAETELFRDRLSIPVSPEDYIPNKEDKAGYEKAFQSFRKNTGREDNNLERKRFDAIVQSQLASSESKKKYRLLQVEGTYSHIQWVNGQVSPEALKNAVEELTRLNDTYDLHSQKIVITMAPANTFGPDAKYMRSTKAGFDSSLQGYSLMGSDSFVVGLNPELHGQSVEEGLGANSGPSPKDALMNTLIHEVGHGIAQMYLGQNVKYPKNHHPDFEDFIDEFGHHVGSEGSHPVSNYGSSSNGENAAEFIKADYLAKQYGQGKSSDPEISRFSDFLESKMQGGLKPPGLKNIVSPDVLSDQEMAYNQPNFPEISRGSSLDQIMQEFGDRSTYYDNGITPFGSKLNSSDNALIQKLYRNALDRSYIASVNPSPENKRDAALSMLMVKEAYDSFFTSYASKNPSSDVDSVKDRVSQMVSPESFTSWSSGQPFIPGSQFESSNRFGNQIALGEYKAKSGDIYQLAYVRSADLTNPENPREKVLVLASKPNQSKDEFFGQNVTLRGLLESSSSRITIGHFTKGFEEESKFPNALEVHGVETNVEEQGKGLATALLVFARKNNKKQIMHSTRPTLSMAAWAHSVDKNPNNHTRPMHFMDRYNVTGNNLNAEPAIQELADGSVVWPHQTTALVDTNYTDLPEMHVESALDTRYTADQLSAIKAHSAGISPDQLDNELTEAFNNEESRLSRSAYLYSGAHELPGSEMHNLLSNKKPGDVIDLSDKYLSSSTSPTIAYQDFGPGVANNESGEEGFMMVIRAPKGSRAIATPNGYTEKSKKEVLLDKGSSLKVVSVKRTPRLDEHGAEVPNAFNTTLEVDLVSGKDRGISLAPSEGLKRSSDSEMDSYVIGKEYGTNVHPNLIDYMDKTGAGLGPDSSMVGYVSTSKLREATGGSVENEEKLKNALDDLDSERGFTDPVVVSYDPDTKLGVISSGDHLVEASHQSGISHVPARVVKSDSSITLDSNPNAIKLGHDWADPSLSTNNFPTNSHPYFTFDHGDVISGYDSVDDDLTQEMLSGVARVGRTAKDRKLREEYKHDPSDKLEQLNPGTYVVDNKTGRVGQVIRYNVERDPSDGKVRYTRKVEVRYLLGIRDAAQEDLETTDEYDSNGERIRNVGKKDTLSDYNDYRQYLEKIHQLDDLTPVTEQFTQSGGTPTIISDTMYGVIKGTDIKGRINRFTSPGNIEVAQLMGHDEYGNGEYRMHEISVQKFAPIQDLREEPQDPSYNKRFPKHSEDMQISIPTKMAITEVMGKLRTYGYLPENIEKAIKNNITGRYVTESGANEILRFLKDYDSYRKAKRSDIDRANPGRLPSQPGPAESRPAVEEQLKPTMPTPVAKEIKTISDLRSEIDGKPEIKSMLDMDIPVISSKAKTNPAMDDTMAKMQRILHEKNVVSDEKANEILGKMPTMTHKQSEKMLAELQSSLLNKRIANDEPIAGLVVPEGFNTSKLEGYTPSRDLPYGSDTADMAGFLNEEERELLANATPEQRAIADHVINSGETMTIIGGGGVGKTFLSKYIQVMFKLRNKEFVTMAPTGVAAKLVKGSTIHSVFKFNPKTGGEFTELLDESGAEGLKKYAPKGAVGFALNKLDTIMLDEVSMVRPDLIDGMDRALRIAKGVDAPFGGVQLVMFGDPYQLPPIIGKLENNPNQGKEEEELDEEGRKVVKQLEEQHNMKQKAVVAHRQTYTGKWFFDAHVWSEIPLPVYELTKIMRQAAGPFVDGLNAVRVGKATEEDLNLINSRKVPNREDLPENVIRVVATKNAAAEVNEEELNKIPAPAHVIVAEGTEGLKVGEDDMYAAERLTVKEGATIMITKNDNAHQAEQDGIEGNPKRWVNGSMAVIQKIVTDDTGLGRVNHLVIALIDPKTHKPEISEKTGKVITHRLYRDKDAIKGLQVQKVFDSNRRTEVDKLVQVDQGDFEQFPLALGYASTIHKIQGATLDNAILDLTEPAKNKNTGKIEIDPLTGEKLRKNSRLWDAGQIYVALSRVRSLQGLFLTRPITYDDIIVDPNVQNFMDKVRSIRELEK